MRTLRNISIFLVVLAVLLIGILAALMHANRSNDIEDITGRNMTTQTRAVGAQVVAIETDGAVDVSVHQGAVASVEIGAEQRMLPKITTRQEGNTLYIDTRGLMLGNIRPMHADVTLPALQKIAQHGSGDLKVAGFSGDRIEVAMHGSGDMHLAGQYKQIVVAVHGSGDLQLEGGSSEQIGVEVFGSGNVVATGQTKTIQMAIRGSGDIDTSKLPADLLAVDIDGSGDASIFARQAAKINLRGSGDVTVHGAPGQREVSETGSGSVRFE